MPQKTLTDKLLRNLKAKDKDRVEYSDSVIANDGSLPGSLIVRVSKSGRKTWVVMYRVGWRKSHRIQKRMSIGLYPSVSLTEAREIARNTLREAASGVDPSQKKHDELTLSEAAERYIERHAKVNQRRWKETHRILKAELIPKYGSYKLSEVGTSNIRDIINTIENRGAPIQANRTLQIIKGFWGWLIERGYTDVSPAKLLKPPSKEHSRDRVLNDREIKLFWHACELVGYPFGSIFKLLLLTGQRRGEVAGMQWTEIDVDGCVWKIPAGKTKSEREHIVPLSAPAISIILNTPRLSYDFLFSTTGKTASSGFSRAKKKVVTLMQEAAEDTTIAPWRLHDLRRTATSGMASLGSGQVTIDKVLNHSSGKLSGVAAIYNRYGYQKEKSEALDEWADYIVNLIETS